MLITYLLYCFTTLYPLQPGTTGGVRARFLMLLFAVTLSYILRIAHRLTGL